MEQWEAFLAAPLDSVHHCGTVQTDRTDQMAAAWGAVFRFLLVDEAWSVCSTFAILGCIRVLFSRIPGLRFVIISESGNGSAFSVPEAVVNVSCFLSHISGLSSPRRLSCRCASFCTIQDLLPARPVSTSVSCMTNLAVCRHFHFVFGSSRALAGFGSCRFGALCVAAWHERIAHSVFKVTVNKSDSAKSDRSHQNQIRS